MKRFLILSVLAAFLAIPAISSARVTTGAGIVPTLTIQANSINGSGNNQSTVMTTQNFVFTKGALFFNVSSVDNYDGGDAGKMQQFKARVSFAGSASSTASGKTTIISNVFMNMSGLVLSGDNKPSAALGCGTVNGTLSILDGGTQSNGNPDPVQNMSFTGSYKMNVALAGFVTDSQGGSNPTSGTATFTTICAGVNGPVIDPDTGLKTGTTPEPVVVNVTLGATPFKIANADGNYTLPAGTANVTGTWNGNIVKSDYSENDAVTLNLVQNGTSLTGTLGAGDKGSQSLTGSVVGKVVTMQFTDSSKGETVTITGSVNADGTMSGTYKSSLGGAGKWGAAKSTVGITGAWTVTPTSTMGKTPKPGTLYLEQFGTTVLGVFEGGGAIAGTISGTSITLTTLDSNGGTIKLTGTANSSVSPTSIGGTSAPGTGTYTDYKSGALDDKGHWYGSKNTPVVSTWTLYHTPDGGSEEGPATFSLTLTGSILTGSENDGKGNVNSITGTLDGSGNITMSFTDDTGTLVTITGSVTSGTFGTSGAYMSGTYVSTGTQPETGTWYATEN